MDQYNENTPSYPENGDEALTFTPSFGEEQTPKKKHPKRALILWLSIGSGALALLVACAALFWPILNPYFVKNTFDELFFDTDGVAELFSLAEDRDLDMSFETELPMEDLGVLLENLYLEMNVTTKGKGEDAIGRLVLEIGAGDEKKELTVYYTSDTLVIKGLCIDEDLCYSLPRKDVEAAMEQSVFHPESGSDCALDEEDYKDLLSTLKTLEATEDEEDGALAQSFLAIWEAWEEILEPKNSLAFAKDGLALSKTTKYTLEEDDLMAMLEAVMKEAEKNEDFNQLFSISTDTSDEKDENADDEEERNLKADLEELKQELKGSGAVLTFSYTVERSRLSEVELTLKEKEGEASFVLTFFYEKSSAGLEAVAKSDYIEDGEDVSVHSTLSLWREVKGTETTFTLESEDTQTFGKESDTQKTEMTLTYSRSTETFELELSDGESDEKIVIEGGIGLDPQKGTLHLSLDELKVGKVTVRDLFSLSLEMVEDAEEITLPDSTPILEMDEMELLEAVRNLDLKQIDLIMEKLTGAPVLGLHYTMEDQVVFQTQEVSLLANQLYRDYLGYLNKQAQSGIPLSNRIFYYDEDLGIYFLFHYQELQEQIKIDLSYAPSENTLSMYHESHYAADGTLEVHSMTVASKTEATCFSDGVTVFHCSICNKDYRATQKSAGHTQVTDTQTVKYDGVNSCAAKVRRCADCNAVFSIQLGDYTSFVFENVGEVNYLRTYYSQSYKNSFYFFIPKELTDFYCLDGFDEDFSDSLGCALVEIPRGMHAVTKGAFSRSDNLQFLILHPDLKVIESGAFPTNDSLRAIYFTGTQEQWNALKKNEYATLWADVPVEIVPQGVTVKTLLDRLYSTTDKLGALENAKNTVKSPDAAKALDAAGFAKLLYEGAITDAAYDATWDLIAIAGKPEQGKTDVRVIRVSTGESVAAFEVEDEIGMIAIGGDFVVTGSATKDTVYIRRISDGTQTSFEISPSYNTNRDPVGGLVIEENRLFVCNSDQHCTLLCYDLQTGTTTKVISSLYQPILYYNATAHRLIAVEDGISSKDVFFINTQSGEKITSYFIQKGSLRVTFMEDHLELENGILLNLDGFAISNPPTGSAPLQIENGTDRIVLQDVASTRSLAAAVCMDGQGRVTLCYKTTETATPSALEYYAEKAISTADGKILFFTPGGYGLILVTP